MRPETPVGQRASGAPIPAGSVDDAVADEAADVTPPARTPRFEYLDGLRGIAAWIVVVQHAAHAFLPSVIDGVSRPGEASTFSALARSPFTILWGGDHAVAIFFVHSGFVLANRFLVTGDRPGLVSQVVKRIVRLGVPVGAALIVAGALWHAGLYRNVEAARFVVQSDWLAGHHGDGRPGLIWSILGGSLLAGSNWWIPPLWTISLEYYGSLLVFGLIAVLRDDRRRRVVYVALILAALLLGGSATTIYAAAFIFGVLLRELPMDRLDTTWLRRAGLLSLFVATVYLAAWPETVVGRTDLAAVADRVDFLGTWFRVKAAAHILAGAGVVAIVLATKPLQRMLSGRLVRASGRISFAVYLLHWPILMTLGCQSFIWARRSGWAAPSAGVAALAVTAAATAVAAVLFERAVDRWAISTANRVGAWWIKEPTARAERSPGA